MKRGDSLVPRREQTPEPAVLLAKQQDEDDMRWLMADPRGRRLMWGWLADAGLFRLSFTGTASGTDFNEGQRNMGIKLHAAVMQHCPEQFVRMLAEAQSPGRAHTAHPGSDTAGP